MAKLLTREELLALSPGDHVWVEYGWGTADEWVVGTIYFDHPELKGMWRRWNRTTVGRVFNIDENQVRCFWDSEPTMEEITARRIKTEEQMRQASQNQSREQGDGRTWTTSN